MALHDKLEYFTDVMKTLLGDLVQQYVAKNPKLMLRRYFTVTCDLFGLFIVAVLPKTTYRNLLCSLKFHLLIKNTKNIIAFLK